MQVTEMAKSAKRAAVQMACATTAQKNEALKCIQEGLQERRNDVLSANLVDIEEAQQKGLNSAMIERLSLQGKLEGMISDIEMVRTLPDPVGECLEQRQHGELQIKRIRTPIGVLGVIYESRPNVTVDIATLAIKSGNCVILRGGSETLRTNKVMVEVIQEALQKVDLPSHAIQMIANSDRSEVHSMLRLHESIDLIIPRGGAALHRFCRENSTIPVITGGIGVCHLFVDETADLAKSLQVILNAKTQRPTVCNALDTLLVHVSVAKQYIPQVIDLLKGYQVEFRLDAMAMEFAKREGCQQATDADWDMEWLSLVLGIKVVKSLSEAIQHISHHSTGHSDGILTESKVSADAFVAAVDSAVVYVNASTRFTDGGQLGLGSEVAISTQKLHARGPMGLNELTTYKWLVSGNYTVRK